VKGLSKSVTRDDLEKLKAAIFYKSEDEMQPDLPAYWRHSKYGRGPFTYEGEQPLELSEDIVPPKPVYKPHAKYPRVAGDSQFGGHTELSAVVNPDGTVRDVRIEQAVGLGFDDAAAQALERWRFQPATRNGKAVAVLIHMEFSYMID